MSAPRARSALPKHAVAPFPRRDKTKHLADAERLHRLRFRAIGGAVLRLTDLGAIERQGRALCLEEPVDDEALVRKWQGFVRALVTRQEGGRR